MHNAAVVTNAKSIWSATICYFKGFDQLIGSYKQRSSMVTPTTESSGVTQFLRSAENIKIKLPL